MGEYAPNTPESIAAEHARQHTLPNGLSTLIRLANDATHLSYPHTELEYMFNSIRDVKEAHEEASNHTGTVAQERVAAAQEYKRTIAWSHMPLVVSNAFDTYRSDGCTPLEDYIQSGIEGLYFRQNLSVLTYLHRAKIAIPIDRQVTELCIIAMQDLTKRNIPDKYKRIVADMYGLHNGQRMTIAQLTKVYGLSSGRYSQIAKSALAANYV